MKPVPARRMAIADLPVFENAMRFVWMSCSYLCGLCVVYDVARQKTGLC